MRQQISWAGRAFEVKIYLNRLGVERTSVAASELGKPCILNAAAALCAGWIITILIKVVIQDSELRTKLDGES